MLDDQQRHEVKRRARLLARSLVGLTEEQAHAIAQGHPGLEVELVPYGQPIQTGFQVGHVTAWVRDGRVTTTSDG